MSYQSGTSTRVTGHTLRDEGAPYVVARHGVVERAWQGTMGRGLCSCGAMSDLVDSGQKRRRWHKLHKQQVLDALVDATLAEADTSRP